MVVPPTVSASMPTPIAAGIGSLAAAANASQEALDHEERRSVRHVRSGERTIDIDLQRRDHAVEMRMRAERQLCAAVEIDRPFFRPVLEREILQRRRSGALP